MVCNPHDDNGELHENFKSIKLRYILDEIFEGEKSEGKFGK